jgi:archaellum component FlaC
MSDIINIKDFYDHETRISIVENAIINIDRRFEQIDKRFEQVDKRFEQIDRRFEQVDRKFDQVDRKFEHLENKMDSHFTWIMASIGALSLTTILSLLTFIFKMH